jgi:hypothetical protein
VLIEKQGIELSMYRRTRQSDGQGGVKVSVEAQLAEQAPVRRFLGGVTYHHLGFNQPTTIGDQRRFGKVLIGTKDDTFKEGDEFLFEGNWYVVGDIIPDVTYERKAECTWLRAG